MIKANIVLISLLIPSITITQQSFATESESSFVKNRGGENLSFWGVNNDLILDMSIYSVIGGEKKEIGSKKIHLGSIKKNKKFFFYEDDFSIYRYVSNIDLSSHTEPDKSSYLRKSVSYMDFLKGFSAQVSGYVYDEKKIMSKIKIKTTFFFCSKKNYSHDNETKVELPDINTNSSVIKSLNKTNIRYTYELQKGVVCNQLPDSKKAIHDGLYLGITYYNHPKTR